MRAAAGWTMIEDPARQEKAILRHSEHRWTPASEFSRPSRICTDVVSQIPVYEYQFGNDLKEHVMRRRHDDWINATHILKAAGFDKPARTRILERDVQKDVHEKIQGGYGKYQGAHYEPRFSPPLIA